MVDSCASRGRPVAIEDPDFYLQDPWPTFAWMQKHAPVYYYEPLDTFVLTRYADIREVANRSTTFVSSRGLFLNDIKYREQSGSKTVTDTFFPVGGEQIGTTDPPRHSELRRVLSPAFAQSALERMRGDWSERCKEVLDQIEPGKVVDWVSLASIIPVQAASRFIGLPDADYDRIRFWSDQLEKLGDELSFEELRTAAAEFATLQQYIIDKIEAKKAAPGGEDLLSVLLAAELDQDKVTQANVVMFAMTMLAAGSDTSRSLLAGLVHTLAQHPEQWTLLRENRSRIANAVEETLRWVTPARAFLRTATEDVSINGRQIRSGQHVYLMYMAGNRDDDAFKDASRFDVTRSDAAKHIAFGAGAHVCAGARLIRLEARIVLDALLDRFSGIELAGPAVPVRHIIRNGWSEMPATFRS
jgi:cytochrome P450